MMKTPAERSSSPFAVKSIEKHDALHFTVCVLKIVHNSWCDLVSVYVWT